MSVLDCAGDVAVDADSFGGRASVVGSSFHHDKAAALAGMLACIDTRTQSRQAVKPSGAMLSGIAPNSCMVPGKEFLCGDSREPDDGNGVSETGECCQKKVEVRSIPELRSPWILAQELGITDAGEGNAVSVKGVLIPAVVGV